MTASPPDPDVPAPPRAREVPCPSCRRPALFHASNPWRPFCCKRCHGNDLSAWATEQFRVGGPVAEDGDQSEAGTAPH